MYKRVDLLVRDDGISHEAFLDAWHEEYLPVVEASDRVVRYQQVLPTEPEHAEFDGLSEVYVETGEDLGTIVERPGGGASAEAGGALPQIQDVLPVAAYQQFAGRATVQKDEVGGDVDGLYEHSAFLVRQEGTSHEAFVDYWQNDHTPIAREIEGVVRYDTVVPHDPESAVFDGVAELYFEDLDALHDALGSEGSRDYDPAKGKASEAREDVDNFLAVDQRPRLIGVNHVVKEDELAGDEEGDEKEREGD